jgi:hypothetical protein
MLQQFLEFSSIQNASKRQDVLQKNGIIQKVETFVRADQAGSVTDRRSTSYYTFGQVHGPRYGMAEPIGSPPGCKGSFAGERPGLTSPTNESKVPGAGHYPSLSTGRASGISP